MSEVIRRPKVDKSDLIFSAKPAPIEYESIHKLGLNENGEQETTKAQRYEIAETKRAAIEERNRKERLAYNFGFSKSLKGFDAYECYRADMRTQHDVYRKPPHSEQWTHNTLWDCSNDTIQDKGVKSNRLCYKDNAFLKKISFYELRAAIRLFRNDASQKWSNSVMFLPDAQSRHAKGVKTPCKKIVMTGLLNLESGEYLVVTAYAVKRQYYVTHEIKLWGFEAEYAPKSIKYGPKMQSRIIDAFDKCHNSHYGIFEYQAAPYEMTYRPKPQRLINKIKAESAKVTEFDFEGFLNNNAKAPRKAPRKAKALNLNLWRAAKSDEIFMEQFRIRVND
jgi:hypothetical protein